MRQSKTISICLASFMMPALLSACHLPRDPMSVEKPIVIEFASRMGTMEADLAGKCDATEVRPFNMIDHPDVTSQFQLDCYGFDYFGAPRLAEFMFVNDALAVVLINIEISEIPALETAFIAQFGEATHSKDTVLAFAEDFSGVRNDPPQSVYFAEFAAPYLIDALELRPDRE